MAKVGYLKPFRKHKLCRKTDCNKDMAIDPLGFVGLLVCALEGNHDPQCRLKPMLLDCRQGTRSSRSDCAGVTLMPLTIIYSLWKQSGPSALLAAPFRFFPSGETTLICSCHNRAKTCPRPPPYFVYGPNDVFQTMQLRVYPTQFRNANFDIDTYSM